MPDGNCPEACCVAESQKPFYAQKGVRSVRTRKEFYHVRMMKNGDDTVSSAYPC